MINNKIEFTLLKAKHRQIIYYLSLYNGYLWFNTKTIKYETNGYSYSTLPKNTSFRYNFLKKKKLHNLKYYNMIIINNKKKIYYKR